MKASQKFNYIKFIKQKIKVIKIQIMSFVERLTKNHYSSHRKETKTNRQPLKKEKQEIRGEKLQIKFEEFQKHHSELKDMLKILDYGKDSSIHDSTEKGQSIEKYELLEKKTMMQSTKQNVRNKVEPKEQKQNSSAVIKYRKGSEEIDSRGSYGFSFLLNNLKNGGNKISYKTEAGQNPESPKKKQKISIRVREDKNKASSENCLQKKGLENIGNTCYMNAVLQCLFHYSDFSENLKQALFSSQENQVARATVITKYLDLYEGIMKNNSQSDLSTLPLKKSVSKICSMFIDFQQQDAHEFLRQMLNTMHQQINLIQSPPKYRTFSFSLLTDNLATVVQEYQKFLKRYDDSFIYDAFSGQMCSFVTCSNCGKQSLTLQYFLDISLPLVKGVTSLQQLIAAYFDSESLWDYYSCQACKKKVKNSIKKIDLWDPPNYLIINLKRSQFGKKNNSQITIPTRTLNMKQYMKNRTQKVQKSGIYRLMGITHHRGALDGGHYWASVRSSNSWYIVDDLNVKKCQSSKFENELEVKGSDTAYLMFYELI